MIILDIGAGLGNQMFMYAFGRAQSLRYNEKLYLDISAFKGDPLRNYTLDKLSLPKEVEFVSEHKLLSLEYHLKKYWYLIRMKLEKADRCKTETVLKYADSGFFSVNSRKYVEPIYAGKYINYYSGMFQSEHYFKDYEGIIRDELKVGAPVSKECIELKKILEECNSVCVHIRRGDYLKKQLYCVCDEEYFDEAIDLMKSKVSDARFFFFSDDPEWVSKKYQGDEYTVVDMNNQDYEDLFLMYHCKHFIISNSTFSWWAQYLSENKKKIVIAPSHWYNGLPSDATDIYMNTWITVGEK